MDTKINQLEALAGQIVKDNICPELADNATQLVFGAGNPDTKIVFIGEAPGKQEDIKGEPFVGAAGKFLDEMLSMVQLKRDDIYITNIVKYRPPGNRDPLPEEKAAFLPYLQRQLAIIQPKVVATLGRHSLNCFLPDLQISQVHGQPKRVRWTTKSKNVSTSPALPLVVLPLYHPAAALYNGGLRQTLVDDFSRLPAILKELES